MIRRLWYRHILKRPPMVLEIKDHLGVVIGHMTVDPGGKFKGQIESEKFRSRLEIAIRARYVASIKMTAVVEPYTPPWKR